MGKSKKGFLFLIIIIILILLLVIGGLVWYILTSGDQEEPQEDSSGKIGYDTSIVVDNPDTMQDVVDGLIQQAAEGTMTLKMKMNAISNDGMTFSCELGNAEDNRYDMFLAIYRDDTQEEIYRSGLIPAGAHIESFKVDQPMDEGVYECTVVYNQVEDDQETIHSQVNVGLTLTVRK